MEKAIKVNYDREMEKIISKLRGEKPKLLIHSCCAPCSGAILEYLRNFFHIDIYFYNPNITFREEYIKRLEEQREYDEKLHYNMKIIEGVYNPTEDFFKVVQGLEKEPEGGKRCLKCYRLRMEACAKKAKELGYEYFTTVLSISPLKNAQWINEIGTELEKEYGIKFLYGDFKKKSRYLRSVELSREHDLYRQDYCGCVFSKVEREKAKELKENESK